MDKTGRLKVGEWLQTDGRSSARLESHEIGSVEVEPNTRLQLLAAPAQEHRLSLAHGVIQARVTAPPRLFYVETPSAVAVDLGCAYTLTVDRSGAGLLRVTLGYVALQRKGREAMVPAGAACRTRPGIGPGTPFFTDASARFREALNRIDFGAGGDGALSVVLSQARGFWSSTRRRNPTGPLSRSC